MSTRCRSSISKHVHPAQVTERLVAVGGALRFVDHCFTCIVRRADGCEAGDAQEVCHQTRETKFCVCVVLVP